MAFKTTPGRRAGRPARVAPGTVGRPSARMLAIFGAVPDGSVRARSQAAWIRAVREAPEAAVLRSDAYANLLAVAWALARYADWTSLCARPTWPKLIEVTGKKRTTVAKYLALLRAWGLLGTVESGSTVLTRGRAAQELNAALPYDHPDRVDGNRAAEYVLCVLDPAAERDAPAWMQPPPSADAVRMEESAQVNHGGDETRTPSVLTAGEDGVPTRAGASENGISDENRARCPQGGGLGLRGERLELCRRLQAEDLTLRRISARMLRHLLRPLLAAGATAGDVRHVLHHGPDGTAWTYTTAPAHVPAWVRWRLAHWLTDDGALRAPLPSQAAAERAAQAAAQRARQRAQAAAQRAAATTQHDDPATVARTVERAQAARQALAAASPSARKIIIRENGVA